MIRTVPALDHSQILSLNCFGDRMFAVIGKVDLPEVDFPIDDPPSKNPPTYGFKSRSGKLLSDTFPSGLDIYCVHVIAHVPVTSEYYMDSWYDFCP